jgi:proteasome lid subunit RPN8/RPN11
MLTPQTKQDIRNAAYQDSPLECCGFILHANNSYQLFRCEPHSAEYFTIPPHKFAEAAYQGDIVAIYHSHTNGTSKPSNLDRMACTYTGYNWVIYDVDNDDFNVIPPEDEVELIGREYVFNLFDCYSLVRDTIRQFTGIQIPDFDRGDFEALNQDSTWNKFREGYESAGFRPLQDGEPLQNFDAILMALDSPSGNPNHCGVMVDVNRSRMYHHVYGRLSQCSIYGSYYRKITTDVVRHKELDS